jgi:hypothetical protein
MLNFTRRRATSAAVQATLPLVKTLEISGPLPDGFWHDPYVLGYISSTISTFAKTATSGKITGADLGYCLFETLGKISGRNGVEIGQRVTSLAQAKDPDFFEGVDAAGKVIAVTDGSREFDDDPDVIAAVKMADSIGSSLDLSEPTDRATRISSCLGIIVFNNRIKKRFGLSTGK